MAGIPNPDGGGLFPSLKAVFSTVLESGRTRLELLSNEIQEEKLRLVDLGFLLLGTVFCLCAAILVAILFLTVLFWEERLIVLGLSGAALALAGFVLAAKLKCALSRPSRIFKTSLAELREDSRQLNEESNEEANEKASGKVEPYADFE